jgi:HTH-like domain
VWSAVGRESGATTHSPPCPSSPLDEHRDRFGGVEPICTTLTAHGCSIDPSTYYHVKKRPPSARAVRDAELKELIARVHGENFGVYGVRKVWRELNRRGQRVARYTVERLMRGLGLEDAVRGGKKVRTTVPDPSAERAPDLVKRNFVAPEPNRCRVADFTYVPAHGATVYVAFVADTFSRRIVGWSAATSKATRSCSAHSRRACGSATATAASGPG